jgi:hypothetical protein
MVTASSDAPESHHELTIPIKTSQYPDPHQPLVLSPLTQPCARMSCPSYEEIRNSNLGFIVYRCTYASNPD